MSKHVRKDRVISVEVREYPYGGRYDPARRKEMMDFYAVNPDKNEPANLPQEPFVTSARSCKSRGGLMDLFDI